MMHVHLWVRRVRADWCGYTCFSRIDACTDVHRNPTSHANDSYKLTIHDARQYKQKAKK